MSAVIALCHFCDQHGPIVLINTRVQYGSDVQEPESSDSSTVPTCCACEMSSQFVSIDQVTQAHYLSSRMPFHLPQLTTWLQHVCVRSLSCEVNPCLFSEQENCSLSVSFSVRDAMARGFYRWFSIVVTMRDLALLAASWQFLRQSINTIIKLIQDKALQVYNLERPFRFNNPPQSRSLSSLTRCKHIFALLHCWFSWLLRAEARYFSEWIPRSPYYHAQLDIALGEGDLRSLQSFFGQDIFQQVALGLLEGKQIVIRGDDRKTIKTAIKTLKMIIPEKCSKDISDSEEYLELETSNLLGVGTHVAVPQPSTNIIRVDILHGNCHLRTLQEKPSRYPTFLTKMLKALDNKVLKDKVLSYHLLALKQEWTNIAKLIHATQTENSTGLLLTLGVQEQDKSLMKFWSKGL